MSYKPKDSKRFSSTQNTIVDVINSSEAFTAIVMSTIMEGHTVTDDKHKVDSIEERLKVTELHPFEVGVDKSIAMENAQFSFQNLMICKQL